MQHSCHKKHRYTWLDYLTLLNELLSLLSCSLTTPQASSLNGCHTPPAPQVLATETVGLSGHANVAALPSNVSGHV